MVNQNRNESFIEGLYERLVQLLYRQIIDILLLCVANAYINAILSEEGIEKKSAYRDCIL